MIFFICRRYCPGEAWTNRVLAYAKGLMELGAKVTIIFLITDAKRTPYTIDIKGVNVINLWEYDSFLERRYRALSYIHNLFRLKRIFKPNDNVFIYGADKRIIQTLSKSKVNIYTEITEHPYIYNKLGKIGEIFINKSYSRLLRDIKGLCVISKHLKRYFTSIGVPENRIRVSNMFVDYNRFDITKSRDVNPYIAYCGILSYNKDGVHILIKSFALFHKLHPDYKLYLIGRAMSENELTSLKQLCKIEKIDKYVIFTGQIAPSIMPQLLVDAKILALSRPNNLQAHHGFPTKLGEYLSTGNPIVVTSVGEIPLFIKDKENGFLAKPDDPYDFARKLCYVADNYTEACKVAAKGQLLIKEEFSYLSQSKVLFELITSKTCE